MTEKALRKLTKDELIEQIGVFHRIAIDLIREDHPRELLPLMIGQAMDLLIADGGSLYIYNGDDKLRFECCLNRSFKTDFHPGDLPLESRSIASHCFKTGEHINIDDVYLLSKNLPYSFNHKMDDHLNYRTKSMISTPLTTKAGKTIGVLQLINRKNYLEEKWPEDGSKVLDMPAFTLADLDTLERFSDFASAVLERISRSS